MILSRSTWTGTVKPERQLFKLNPDVVKGVAVHYTGSRAMLGQTASLVVSTRRLEAERRQHVNDNGWSDIAYQYAIDQEGRVFELRGVDYRSAANGNQGTNSTYGAVTFLIGVGDTPTPAALEAFRKWRQDVWLKKYPRATAIVGHRDLYATACPGDPLYNVLSTLRTAPKVHLEDDMPSAEDVAKEVWNRFTVTTPDGKELNLQATLELILKQLAESKANG